ncbi:MAG: TetR/AcrR family transcriptional regulator [Melioribacteraceae bacterium]|nr:TetR/AcrR family transcriptional regulator [Melioribacteraceae bacterium]MCF8354119.1 TetR/AcrR family transcriptional regulator [Melioribacteraceae bacterium]MCF8393346.1 TetR/AcrR family transcriptional regulator [Melioribacteraceae bacterium]MCF8418911.1 TetR/AcrR family transcriptional regulator [Melioribacteraceae bacterium]
MARLTTVERQKMIIDEAINIIHEGGYESLSIRELAGKVKISEPAIYRHFLNKEDIILGILSRIGEFDHLLEENLALGNTAVEKLRKFIQFHFDFLQKNKEMTSILFSEDIFNQSNLLKQKLLKIIKYRKSLLTSIVEQGKAENEFKQIGTSDVVTMILGFIRLTVLEWRLGGFGFNISNKSEKTLGTIKEMISK